jgi:Glycosyltransferase
MNAPQRPRLLVLASTYPRWANDHEPGFVHALSKRLAERFEVVVLCPHAPGAATTEALDGVLVTRYRYAPAPLERLVNNGGIITNLRRHPWMFLLLPGFFLGQLFALSRLVRHFSPAVIHAHWIIPQGFIAALAGAMGLHRAPILVTSHGSDLHALNGWLLRKIKRWVLRRCARATVVSAPMLQPLQDLGVPPSRISVAPMGVDTQLFLPEPGTQRSSHDLLFVGRLVDIKGLRHLIAAMPLILSRHPNATLTIAGFGPELAERQEQVRLLGIEDKVRFLGAVTHEQLAELYRRAAVLIAPFDPGPHGQQEGLGLVVAEALACDCPVVTTAIAAVRELFEGQWPPYLAEPGNPASLAHQIDCVLANHVESLQWAARIRPRILTRFGWEAVAAGYAAELEQIAVDQGSPRN